MHNHRTRATRVGYRCRLATDLDAVEGVGTVTAVDVNEAGRG